LFAFGLITVSTTNRTIGIAGRRPTLRWRISGAFGALALPGRPQEHAGLL